MVERLDLKGIDFDLPPFQTGFGHFAPSDRYLGDNRVQFDVRKVPQGCFGHFAPYDRYLGDNCQYEYKLRNNGLSIL